MIDPDNIILAKKNDNSLVTINNIPPFDGEIWDLDDPKDMKRYFKTVENEIRQSFEYKEMIFFIKNNFDMNQCAYIQYDPSDSGNIRIEVHHSPFTLFDIVLIVYKKRIYYQEALESRMLAKECTILHYRLLIGLIPLSKTVHQLVHDGKLFIPANNVMGNYKEFLRLYKPFCDEEQLETLDRIEKYSTEYSELHNTSILDRNYISYNVIAPQFQLPNLDKMEDRMINRISEIKKNGYHLPTLEDYQNKIEDSIEDRRMVTQGIDVFDFY